ncbi:MAG: cytochrome c biogenesis protein [Schleiferiaceae bacterium]|nr:cytochrome c biogenesis protein [Schleiferiaceae bacterium]MDR9442145.1 cytochrome c biogenesis protein [Schleiferiaceae bacterium]
MRQYWWKLLGVLLILFSLIWGILGPVPALPILHETIRVLYYHVPMWFAMIALMSGSLVYSIMHLRDGQALSDVRAREMAMTGFVLAGLGLVTGSVWARFTWGAFWVNDPKLNGTAVTMLIYLAYFVLRQAVEDGQKRGRLGAVYNIFAYVMMIVFIGILPRLTDSLHPGNGGNPGFNKYDLNNNMRPVFYSAVLGWILVGFWISQLRVRYQRLKQSL